MARILIVGGGTRALSLARSLLAAGHAVRVTAGGGERLTEIEAAGAEPWIGTPERLATLRGALDGVAVACWLLAGAGGEGEEELGEVEALHGSRLEFFLGGAIDSTLRGFLYEASPGELAAQLLADGSERVGRMTAANAIPCEVLQVPLGERDRWLAEALAAINRMLGCGAGPGVGRRR